MSVVNKSHATVNPIIQYICDHSLRLHPVQQKLIEVTKQQEYSMMLGSSEELQLLGNLVKYMGFKKTLDIGVYTGYSSLSIALALPEDGKIVACDVNEKWTSIGKKHWKEAGVDHKIDLILAPATETLQKLLDDNQAGTFDFAFIDADKPNYDNYYEMCLNLLRPGGVIAVDNVLWGGKVANQSDQSESTKAIRALNEKIHKDNRVDMSMLNQGDGTTLAFKKFT